MQSKEQSCNLISRIISRAATAALAIATVFALTVVLTQSAQAQTFKVIHTFTGGADGGEPAAGLTMDRAGNLYGTAEEGGAGGYGTVFQLKRSGANWTFNTLYGFAGGRDAGLPLAGVIFGPNGSLYGTTQEGGEDCSPEGCGTVFNLKPFPTACKTALCGWQETVLYRFTGGSDGSNPGAGELTFDQAGNIYGTTGYGGLSGNGTVFELAPSNGGWTESVLYDFSGKNGSQPTSGVIFDSVGNLYGTTWGGGADGAGTAFELTYLAGSGWTESFLYSFTGGNDGGGVYAGLIFDQSGNLYGTTAAGGSGKGGTVFELTPSNGSWTLNTLYSFTGGGNCGPWGTVVMDGQGNLYGTTYCDGPYEWGTVFKLTPSGNGWTYTDLHDFTGGSDGGFPEGNVTVDPSGNLYGTTWRGGAGSACGMNSPCGVVWEITP